MKYYVKLNRPNKFVWIYGVDSIGRQFKLEGPALQSAGIASREIVKTDGNQTDVECIMHKHFTNVSGVQVYVQEVA